MTDKETPKSEYCKARAWESLPQHQANSKLVDNDDIATKKNESSTIMAVMFWTKGSAKATIQLSITRPWKKLQDLHR